MLAWFRTMSWRGFMMMMIIGFIAMSTVITMRFISTIVVRVRTGGGRMTQESTDFLFVLEARRRQFERHQAELLQNYLGWISRTRGHRRSWLLHIHIHRCFVAATVHGHRHSSMIVAHRIETARIVSHRITLNRWRQSVHNRNCLERQHLPSVDTCQFHIHHTEHA